MSYSRTQPLRIIDWFDVTRRFIFSKGEIDKLVYQRQRLMSVTTTLPLVLGDLIRAFKVLYRLIRFIHPFNEFLLIS